MVNDFRLFAASFIFLQGVGILLFRRNFVDLFLGSQVAMGGLALLLFFSGSFVQTTGAPEAFPGGVSLLVLMISILQLVIFGSLGVRIFYQRGKSGWGLKG